MANKVLGSSTVSGFLGENPDWANISCPNGRTLQSVWPDGTVQFWDVSDTQESGGYELADGNYANPVNVAGGSLPEIAGYFVDGFVFKNPNQVGIDASGNSWQYVGTSPLPYPVAAGTVPSAPDYEKVFESTASNVNTSSGGSVQDYIDGNLTPFKTVADMKAAAYLSTLPELTRIDWQGYYKQSDGGGNWGVLKFGVHTEDGGSIFSIDDEVYVEANLKGKRLNVLKFGLKEGVDFDNSPIITRALSFNSSIKIPLGRFHFQTKMDIPFKVSIKGESSDITGASNMSSVLIKHANLKDDGILLRANSCFVSDLIIDGEEGNEGDGLVFTGTRTIIDNCGFFNAGRDGLRVGRDAVGANSNLFKLSSIKAKYNGRHGVHISQPSASLWDANAGNFSDGDLQYNGECGVYLDHCAFNTFINLGCQENGTYGLYATDSGGGHKFFGGDFEVNGRPEGSGQTAYYDFYLSDNCENNTIIGISSYNFPRTLYIGSENNTTLGISEGTFSGDDQYRGLGLVNKESGNPQILDWYQELDFTPEISGSTTSGTCSYGIQKGFCTRVGNMVTIFIDLSWSGHDGTGDMRVTNLPFQNKNSFTPMTIIPVNNILMTPNRVLACRTFSNLDFLQVGQVTTGVSGNENRSFLNLEVQESGHLSISGTYLVN